MRVVRLCTSTKSEAFRTLCFYSMVTVYISRKETRWNICYPEMKKCSFIVHFAP